MDNILLTGSSGFVGGNLVKCLEEKYNLFTPSRNELNLYSEIEIKRYIEKNRIKSVISCASPSPGRKTGDKEEKLLADSLNMFLNIIKAGEQCDKIIYFGSGAEFDKTKDICLATEGQGDNVPDDNYGLAKFVMNRIANNSANVYNLRLFGCYGPNDYYYKFITHVIRSLVLSKTITIRQDCYFDYIHIYDLAEMVKWIIDGKPVFHEYNACGGTRILLSDIAKMICQYMDKDEDIRILKAGFANEYTGNNERIIKESGIDLKYPYDVGLKMQIAWELNNWNDNTLFDGE